MATLWDPITSGRPGDRRVRRNEAARRSVTVPGWHDRMSQGPAELVLRADAAPVRLLVFSGRPLKEPVAFGGPFVMNTQDEVHQAFAFRAGRFWRWAGPGYEGDAFALYCRFLRLRPRSTALVAFASAATHAAFCVVCLADPRLGPVGQWMIDYLSNPSSR